MSKENRKQSAANSHSKTNAEPRNNARRRLMGYSEKQLEAYLLSRELLRQVKHMSIRFSVPPPAASSTTH